MSWTPEKVAKLKTLWTEGHSANQIGKKLGVSRNAVIGKIHRLGIGKSIPPPRIDPSIVQVDFDLSSPSDDLSGSSFATPGIAVGLQGASILSQMGEIPLATRKRARIKRPPGGLLLGVAEFLYSRKTFEHVFQQTVADMREEYYFALSQGREWKARLVIIQGYCSCAGAAALHLPVSLAKIFGAIWRLGGG